MNEEKLRKKYIEAARKAPAKVFADGIDGMTEEQVREKLIEHYRERHEDDFEYMECMYGTEAVCDILRANAIEYKLIDRNAAIAEFYNFFDKVQSYSSMHLNVYYSHIMDWSIYIYKKGCADDYPDEQRKGSDSVVANVQSGDNAEVCVMAHGALLRWMKKYYNYEE